jgi:hypothetical protein
MKLISSTIDEIWQSFFKTQKCESIMKGFFSFAISIAALIILLFLCIGINENNLVLEKTKHELMKAEIANKDLTILENNVDKIINLKLNEQILKRNYNTALAQKEINSKVANYLTGKAKASTINFEETGEVTENYLTQNSSVTILTAHGLTYAEYTFTSSPLLNTTVSKKLGNQINSYFQIPIGYTQQKIQITG